MSTRSSLVYVKFKQKELELHVYHELMDDGYYITDESHAPVRLPSEEVAKKIADILRPLEVN